MVWTITEVGTSEGGFIPVIIDITEDDGTLYTREQIQIDEYSTNDSIVDTCNDLCDRIIRTKKQLIQLALSVDPVVEARHSIQDSPLLGLTGTKEG